MYGQSTVAMCDILGFKNLVASTDLPTLVDDLLVSFRRALEFAMNKGKFPNAVPTLADIDRNPKIGIAWFSDTLLLYTREDSDDCLQELLATLGWLVFVTIDGHTPIRAAVAYGDAFIDAKNSLYVGQPIVEAHEWEQQQHWVGASLADSAMDRIPAGVVGYADWWIIPYDVPIKGGHASKRLAINWAAGFHRPGDYKLEWPKEAAVLTEKDRHEQMSICEKWKNTKKFHDSVCRFCNRR
jgi:hypothetical protein